jgi:hypothetical protein
MHASFRLLIGWAILVSLPGVALDALSATARPDMATGARAVADYGKLPMAFEPNQGQADRTVRFLARGPGYGLYLTPTEAVLNLHGGTATSPTAPAPSIRLRLAGANPRPEVSGVDLLPGTSNYFLGNDPKRWHSAIPNYAKVRYAAVYPGIDLVYYGRRRQLEYDFVVAPGADPGRIVLDFRGIEKLSLDREGNLVLATAAGDVVWHKPVVYQEVDGLRQPLDGRYRLRGRHRVSFEVAHYDVTRPLVIDPTLIYSTHLGGAARDVGNSIAVDGEGNAYVTGSTGSNYAAAGQDIFVAKLNPVGNSLVYSTYLGGSTYDEGRGIAVDAAGNAYVTGMTQGGLSTTPGAYQATHGGGSDAFVTKLDATGTALIYSTYLGGSGDDVGTGISVDGSGHAFVTGYTMSGFPTSPGAFQTTYGGGSTDAFVSSLNATG